MLGTLQDESGFLAADFGSHDTSNITTLEKWTP